jgi:hypothetical protein
MTDTATATPIPSTVTTPTGGTADPIAITSAPAPTIESARARRAEILNNPELGEKYYKGDSALRDEMRKLNETIANGDIGALVQSALNGVPPDSIFADTTSEGIFTRGEYASAAKELVPLIGREGFEAFVAGRGVVNQAKHDEAVAIKRAIMTDKQWLQAYLEGSAAHKAQMTRVNLVLGCRIVEEKA